MKKKYITAGLSLSLIALFPTVMQAEDCCMPSYQPATPLCDDEACAVYSTYAGTQLNCGWNVYGWGEFLYWRPISSTCINAITFEGDPLGSTQVELKNSYGYRPAFRVGIGMVAHDFDDWIFNADYTWFHHSYKTTHSVTAPVTLASTIGIAFTSPLYSSIITKSDFNFDIVSVNIQRPNYLGQNVILSPFLGLKWMKRNLKLAQDLLIAGTNLVDNQHGTWSYSSLGVGAGFDGNWLLCWRLRLIGKADVALFYPYERKFYELDTPAVPFPGSPFPLEQREHFKHLSIYGKGGLGIGWGAYLCCNRYHVDLSTTFDFVSDVSKLSFATGLFLNATTMFMGLTVHGQFDF